MNDYRYISAACNALVKVFEFLTVMCYIALSMYVIVQAVSLFFHMIFHIELRTPTSDLNLRNRSDVGFVLSNDLFNW